MKKIVILALAFVFALSAVCLAATSSVKVVNEREDIYIGIAKFNDSMTSYEVLKECRLKGAGETVWKLETGCTYGITFYHPVWNTIIAYTNFIPENSDSDYFITFTKDYNLVFEEVEK